MEQSLTEYKRQWRLNHRQQCNISYAKYRRSHAEKRKAYLHTYRKNHKDDEQYKLTKALGRQRRRAKTREAVIEDVSFEAIKLRDRMICGICHCKVKEKELSFDHIIPLSAGGAHAEYNLQVAHRLCNSSKCAGRIPTQIRIPFK